MSEIAIQTQKLGKSYDGAVYALHDLSLELPAGTVFGFLGPRGSGKTTAVKLLSGLLKPTDGSCTVFGVSPDKEPTKVHRFCGVVTETAKMYDRLTGMENMLFFGQSYGLEKQECKQRAETVLKSLDLWDLRNQKLAAYSAGMVQRLSLARAMLSRPKLLLLDEPASSMEPEFILHINSILSNLASQEGVTVFLCTRQLRFAQGLCNRYGIVNKGEMLACGDLDSLSCEVGMPLRARFRLCGKQAPEGLVRLEDGWWGKNIAEEEEMPVLLKHLISSGFDIYEAQVLHPSLEDVYFRFLQ